MTRDTATITETPHDVTVEMHGVEITICKSGGADNATVVYVDTAPADVNEDGTPTCRILLNDAPVYVGTAYDPTDPRGPEYDYIMPEYDGTEDR